MGRCHFISAWREQKCHLNGPRCLVWEFQKCHLNGPAGHGCHLNRPGGSTPDSQKCHLNRPAGCHLNGPGRSFSSQPRRSCLPGEGEEEGGNGNIGPDCGASDPGAPSGLPDDLNGILPELASADFSKMPFKWSGLDAI